MGNVGKENNFDICLDYENYFYDFYKIGIDLTKDKLNWWKFLHILKGILLDDSSSMSKIISFRTYEKPSSNPKINEEKEHNFRMKMKRIYSLPYKNKTDNGFEKLWNYVEKKAGEKKE